jgi:tetratricopeptide (TPR) repeat protein
MTEEETRTDFFISYTSADRPWAEWIAWQLEQAGSSTVIQAWDFTAGSNFVLEMDTAAKAARRTIAVLSPDYFHSGFAATEWAARLRQDPRGAQRLLVPVRVRDCDVEGLLGSIVYIDLVEQDEQTARTRLLAGVRGERAIPATAPPYPVSASSPTSPTERPAFPGALPSLWNVPYRRNPYFTGREDLLTRLHEQLRAEKATALSQPQAISGLGGIGKTQTAVEYAYRFRDDYQAVLWVSAASREALIADFVALATLLQLPEREIADQSVVVAAVLRWLESHGDWLLILDNADDLQMTSAFMPVGGTGHLLLTTRAQSTGTLASSLAVEKMESAEGALLLLRRAKLLAPGVPLEQAKASDRALAETLVAELDGLPLALDQAGAYLEETDTDLEGYLVLYRTHRTDLLQRRGKLRTDHPEPVATTWSLSFGQVEQRSPAAADLLRLCAFLDPEAIPEDILKEGAAVLGPTLKPLATDAFKRNEAMEALRAFSLLKRNAETKMLNVHRLVQVVLRESMDKKAHKRWAERAIRAVHASFPQGRFENWEQCQRYLPHALACATLIEQYAFSFPDAAELLTNMGWYLREHARYAEAEDLLQRALVIYEHLPEPPYLEYAIALNELGRLHQAQGTYVQAVPLYQHALDLYEQHRGPDHPHTAVILDNLAQVYQFQGKYTEAEPLYQRALAIKEQTLGPDHPETATTLQNLALLYQAQDKYTEAEPLYQRALAIYKQALPPDHPETATTLQNLALLYQAQGKYAEAEPLYQRALAIREQALGPDHPYTAITLKLYASLLRKMQRTSEATTLERRANAIQANSSS